MIVLILVLLPRELGRLAETYRRSRVTGGSYKGHSRNGHVVFCGGHVHTDTVRGQHSESRGGDRDRLWQGVSVSGACICVSICV